MIFVVQRKTGKGTFAPLPAEKQVELHKAFVNGKYRSVLEIAQGLGIAKATVSAYRNKWAVNGQLSESNWFVNRPRAFRPNALRRLYERRLKMAEHVIRAAKEGDKVSANELQKMFGGEKKIASRVLEEVSASLASRRKPVKVLRKTVRDQPYRRRNP